ncbi:MAG: hypothetical protein KDA84_06805, partial [Planctomycetaceae bacterium]|nr:hypothetical protein [Planctomycetaceae bacterium]
VFNGENSSVYRELDDSAAIQNCQPVLWTKDGLQFLPGFDSKSNWWPTGISDEGSVIVGVSWPVGEKYGTAFRWENGEAKLLGSLPGYTSSVAKGVSGDGSVVVGRCILEEEESRDDAAFVWDRGKGLRPLSEDLVNAGCNPGGWSINGCKAISNDGNVIIGNGYNPNWQRESWYARLPRAKRGGGVETRIAKPTPRVAPSQRLDASKITDFVTFGFDCKRPVATNDGKIAVGSMTYGGDARSFLWNRSQGLIVLPLPAGFTTSQATIIDPQGTKIVGRTSGPEKPPSVVTWTRDGTNPTVIRPLGDWHHFVPSGAHADLIVGWASAGNPHTRHAWCFRNGRVQKLKLPAGANHVDAYIVSADASSIVGNGWSGSVTSRRNSVLNWRVLRWREEKVEEISGFSKDYHFRPYDLSANASIIVGYCWLEGTDPRHAASWPFRWEEGRCEILDVFSNSQENGVAEAVTDDGQVVVGQSVENEVPTAFIWDKAHGLRRLADVFQAAGGELHGWKLESAISISSDGTYITGLARHPDGRKEGYVLKLPKGFVAASTRIDPAIAEKREEKSMP